MSISSPVDHDRLEQLLDDGFGPEGASEDASYGLHLAVAASHGGDLAFERYGATADPSTELISWSMAKSVTHALVGLLVKDGLIDPSARVAVPGWDDERSAITLEHLLAMSSGLEFVEDYVDDQISHVIEMLFGVGNGDVASYAASFPLIHEPGTTFNYSSGTTNIISALCGRVIETTSNGEDDVTTFLQRRLFDPVGMTSARIQLDDAGTFIGSSFVFATVRDFLRFGRLYLQDGVWDGERLLPEGWAAHARRPVEVDVADGPHWYGRHWWLWDDHCRPEQVGFDCSDIDGFAAHGYEGQYLVVCPSRDLVVCRLGKTPVEQQPEVRSWLADIIRCFPERSSPG